MKVSDSKHKFAGLLAGLMLLLAPGAGHTKDTSVKPVASSVQKLELTVTTHTLQSRDTLQARDTKVVRAQEVILPPTDDGLRFNFRGVPLDTVLDYLGKAAGFIIVREATLEGRVDVVSHRSLNREESVALLNTVLNQKGYAAIQHERTLKIVTLEEARKRDIPVKTGRDAGKIKKTDEMITQIIPVRYANATQLIPNIEALLPPYASISANESSNAVVLTATQTDIRRMVEIISALDTSISDISTLKVYMLKHADATELAKLIGDLFKPQSASTTNAGPGGRGGMPFGPMAMMFGGRGGGGGGGNNNSPDSAARQAASRVTAIADTRTNAVVVSAPDDILPTITQLVQQIDTSTEQFCEIRVFTLRYANATNMAQLINDVYQPNKTNTASNNQGGGGSGGFMRRFMAMGGGGNGSSAPPTDSRKAQESAVLAVADLRTNSVVLNANKDIMNQVAPMIESLDNDPSKEKKVFVYPLKYADAQQTAAILDDMFGDGSFSASNKNSSDIFDDTNTNSNSTSGRSSGGSVPSGMGL